MFRETMAVHSEIFGATTVPWMLPRDTFIYHCDSKGSQWGLRLWKGFAVRPSPLGMKSGYTSALINVRTNI